MVQDVTDPDVALFALYGGGDKKNGFCWLDTPLLAPSSPEAAHSLGAGLPLSFVTGPGGGASGLSLSSSGVSVVRVLCFGSPVLCFCWPCLLKLCVFFCAQFVPSFVVPKRRSVDPRSCPLLTLVSLLRQNQEALTHLPPWQVPDAALSQDRPLTCERLHARAATMHKQSRAKYMVDIAGVCGQLTRATPGARSRFAERVASRSWRRRP